MKRIALFLILGGFILSCQINETKQPIQNSEKTPQALSDGNRASSSDIGRRYNSDDIVEKLFNEALSMNLELRKLAERIENTPSMKMEHLNDYKLYAGNNSTYYNVVEGYLMQMKDSSLRSSLSTIFKKSENDYKARISEQKSLLEEIDSKTSELEDRVIIMKLLVTETMIRNYQRNELPNLEKLKSLKDIYDTLLNDTKQYTQF